MTSLKAFLPPEGSAVWRKDRANVRRSSSLDNSPVVKHVVIREVWQKKVPTRHAVYKIDVMTKSNHWFVLRRFRQFNKLHKMLVRVYGVPKDMLPSKKLSASSMSIPYLESRRQALEHYLQRLVNSSTYVSNCPEIFDFLEVRSHDVFSVTKALAKELFLKGDAILASGNEFVLSPTQVYCITRQLQLPEAGQTFEDVEENLPADLGHLYSFIYHLQKLCVSSPQTGRASCQDISSHLEFDISLFKDLQSLRLEDVQVNLVTGLPVVQQQLNTVAVKYCLKTMKQFLVDCIQERRRAPKAKGSVETWRSQAAARLTQNRVVVQPWHNLTTLDLSNNKIAHIDSSLKLLPVLQQLNLSYNEFVLLDLQQISCPTLTHLRLEHNEIHFVSGTSRDLRHLKSLILNHNKIQALNGLESLSGLIELDLSTNDIQNHLELEKLMLMAQLKYLLLAGNSICKDKAYRETVLCCFKGREIVLDNQPITVKEREKLKVFPTRIRASTSPVRTANTFQEAQLISDVRSHSFDEFCPSLSTSDDGSQDSGIDGNSILRGDIITVSEDLEDDRNMLEQLDFSWSYFANESIAVNSVENSNDFAEDRATVMCAPEEQGMVEPGSCRNQKDSLCDSLEVALVVGESGDENEGNHVGTDDNMFLLYEAESETSGMSQENMNAHCGTQFQSPEVNHDKTIIPSSFSCQPNDSSQNLATELPEDLSDLEQK